MSAKRGPYRKCYLVPHRTGFKYCRAVPKDLQPIEGKRAWLKCLGPVSRAVAETIAHALAYEHGKRILAFRAGCTDAESASLAEFAVPDQTKQRPGLTLMQLVELWERVRRARSEIARSKARRCVRRFIDLIGEMRVPDVTRAHCVAYRDALEALPWMKQKNVTEHLNALHVLFAVAMSEGQVDHNPLTSIKARETTTGLAPRRLGFTSQQVSAIFDSLSNESEHFRWIVRLLAYQGMRSGEACQLRCEDVVVLYGVPVLRIHDQYGSVKNRPSIRDIPIHPACLHIQEVAIKAAAESPEG